MSRGFGAVQREILAALWRQGAGVRVLVGDGGASYRRAAHGLMRAGAVRLEPIKYDGRVRLAAYLVESKRDPAETREPVRRETAPGLSDPEPQT